MRSNTLFFPLILATVVVGAGIYLILQGTKSEHPPADVVNTQALEQVSSIRFPQVEKPAVVATSVEIPQQQLLTEPAQPATQPPKTGKKIAYKWVDEQGQTHYGDHANAALETVEVNAVYSQPVLSVLPVPLAAHSSPDSATTDRRVRTPRQTNRPDRVQHYADIEPRQPAKQSLGCQAAEDRLDYIKSIMRAGYNAKQADKLHQRELKAREDRRRFCR